MSEKCIFCEIVNKNLKSYQIDESNNFIAILDAMPVEYGHVLVISKKHYRNFLEVDLNESKEGIEFVLKVANNIKKRINCDGFNITTNINSCANQVIFHFHWHIIPRYNQNPYRPKSQRLTLKENDFLVLKEKLKNPN